MSIIRLDTDSYEFLIDRLGTDTAAINPVMATDASIGTCVSDTVQSYYDMYCDITTIMRYYKWSLQHIQISLKGVEAALLRTDQNLADTMN